MSDNHRLPPFRALQVTVPHTSPNDALLADSPSTSSKITLPSINNLNLPMKKFPMRPCSLMAHSTAVLGYTYSRDSQLLSPNSQTQSSPNTPLSPIHHHDTDVDNDNESDNSGSQDPVSISSSTTPDAEFMHSSVSNPRKLRKLDHSAPIEPSADHKSGTVVDSLYMAARSLASSDSDSESNSDHYHKESVSPTEESFDNGIRKWKPRKKRQCPECKLYFSNLATHKSTHLNPDSRPHVCEYCSRGFARPNDLFRHVKCHWKEIGSDKGQFRCPYKNHPSGDHCGHNTGIFSRCDTFKNHLKAIHFQYPSGTKKDQRSKSNGSCRICQRQFDSVEDWLTNHIEKNQCPYANEYKKTN